MMSLDTEMLFGERLSILSKLCGKGHSLPRLLRKNT